MTSSLVGSEMCIRDRCSNTATGEWESGAAGLNEPRQLRGRTHTHTHTPTVSYTHLTLPTICSV
eukprot:9636154-Prorocentrum_lima.AAC.1